MKKILLSLTMLSMLTSCKARTWESERNSPYAQLQETTNSKELEYFIPNRTGNQFHYDGNDVIKKKVEKYVKDSLANKYTQYKSISTIVVDTIKVGDYFETDSLMLNHLIENQSAPFILVTQRELINQGLEMRKRIAPNSIDYKAVKMYKKPNLSIETILKASKENSKKVDMNKETHILLHIFDYKNKDGGSVTDTAIFVHSPETIRLVSSASKYNKGVTFTGTIKSIRNFMTEVMNKLPKLPSPSTQPADKK